MAEARLSLPENLKNLERFASNIRRYSDNNCVLFVKQEGGNNYYNITCSCCIIVYTLDENGQVATSVTFNLTVGYQLVLDCQTQFFSYCN
jgi:hypothetical protein